MVGLGVLDWFIGVPCEVASGEGVACGESFKEDQGCALCDRYALLNRAASRSAMLPLPGPGWELVLAACLEPAAMENEDAEVDLTAASLAGVWGGACWVVLEYPMCRYGWIT